MGALGMQYAADALFTYKVSQETWTSGTTSELLYLAAYFLMTVAIIKLGSAYVPLRAIIVSSQNINPVLARSKTRFAIGKKIRTNAYTEMISLFGTIRAKTKKHFPRPHTATTPRTFP